MIERYTRPEMGSIWSDQSRFDAWLEVELAVCEAWHRLGRIEDGDMAEIREKAGFDLERIYEIEQETRHDVIAFLTAVEEKVGPASRFIHLGCTSSDIVDTANALLLVKAGKLILADIDKFMAVLRELIESNRGRLCMGRTHGIHAE
ncbi:MAG: adenylosuccinate lyase, partial [Desulfovibrionaceae bacterium]|nr:adenylosuccinate lyase [Desulfovibrionaceae bacterium]